MGLILRYNFLNLLARRTSTLMTALGIACVVAVFVLIMALAQGFRSAVTTTGYPENALLLRDGATSEISSAISRERAQLFKTLPFFVRDENDEALVCPEMVIVINHPKLEDGQPTNVTVRGTSANIQRLRPDFSLSEGRFFEEGTNEVIVGRSISRRIKDCQLGGTITKGGTDWKVVGVFDVDGSAYESEIWGDVEVLLSAFNREVYQSVTALMPSPGDISTIEAAFADDPRLKSFEVKREDVYYEEQSGRLVMLLWILGGIVTAIMSVGAILGAMNTMYASVSGRIREIGTLLAIGFSPQVVFMSFLGECLFLCLLGGLLGCIVALPLNGMTTGTTNWATFSEVAFDFEVTPTILGVGMLIAALMGVMGGVLPAYRASRMRIVETFRR